jgi:hypothetical protein
VVASGRNNPGSGLNETAVFTILLPILEISHRISTEAFGARKWHDDLTAKIYLLGLRGCRKRKMAVPDL